MFLGKYFGDIVVGDIGQPQCQKCLFSLSFTRLFCHFVHLWHCGIYYASTCYAAFGNFACFVEVLLETQNLISEYLCLDCLYELL